MSATMTTNFGQRAGWTLVVVLFCASCTTMPEKPANRPDRVVISNLSYGPICGPNDIQTICSQSSDISVTGSGSCIYNGQEIACTWYGFSFDYPPLPAPVSLDCTYSSSVPQDIGNPKGVQSKNSTAGSYELELDNSGHLFQSQYSGWRPGAPDNDVKTICSYKGEKVFEVEFHLHFQPGTAPRKDS